MTDILHNMSVPSTSRVTVARTRPPGLRFVVDLEWYLNRRKSPLRERLARRGWAAAWEILAAAGDAPRGASRAKDPAVLERHLERSLRKAGVPNRIGLLLEDCVAAEAAQRLRPAATLAVLARRSGPLYLPSRRLEPSLADPQELVLFFPQEAR